MLNEHFFAGSSVLDDRLWLFTGGFPDQKNQSEYWDGSAFRKGSDLEESFTYHCQVIQSILSILVMSYLT